MAQKSHRGLICSFWCKHGKTLLSLTILELQAEQYQQGKHDPELHHAAPEVTLSARSGNSGGEAGQRETALLLSWNSAGSNHPEGTASSILLAAWEQKGEKYIFWSLLLLPTKERKHVLQSPLLVRVWIPRCNANSLFPEYCISKCLIFFFFF